MKRTIAIVRNNREESKFCAFASTKGYTPESNDLTNFNSPLYPKIIESNTGTKKYKIILRTDGTKLQGDYNGVYALNSYDGFNLLNLSDVCNLFPSLAQKIIFRTGIIKSIYNKSIQFMALEKVEILNDTVFFSGVIITIREVEETEKSHFPISYRIDNFVKIKVQALKNNKMESCSPELFKEQLTMAMKAIFRN